MFRALHHFNLIVSDKEKTKAFYHDVLGLEIALETEIDDPEFSRGVGLPGTKVLATFFKLPDNNGLIETFQYLQPSGTPITRDAKANNGGWQHLCFQVDCGLSLCSPCSLRSRSISCFGTATRRFARSRKFRPPGSWGSGSSARRRSRTSRSR